MTAAMWLMLWSTTAAVPVGTELRYVGTFQREDGAADKTFTLVVTATGGEQLDYLLEERGGLGWDWPRRYGRLALETPNPQLPRLLYLLNDSPTTVAIRSPLFTDLDQLRPDSSWRTGDIDYVCRELRPIEGREVAVVEANLPRSRRQELEIDPRQGWIVSLKERLFLGRGEAFVLTMRLESQSVLPVEGLARTTRLTSALMDLQARLVTADSLRPVMWTPEHLKLAEDALRDLKGPDDCEWSRFVAVIERDLAAQSRKLAGVEGLAKKYLGQTVESGDWTRVDGTKLTASERAGKTLVLHFWDYNGEHLAEPYGQVGYLDFLHQRRTKLGALVVGIAVDERFRQPTGEGRAALRGVKKLQEFMNVSFPIVTDDGALLTRFGDPRALGAELPLWVVVGHDGKVVAYHVGFYDLQPDEGLKALDAAVVEALKAQKRK